MNTRWRLWSLVGAVLILAAGAARAVVFTTNTAISAFNTNYDGADIVITNCTVTMDGPHAFASLQVAAGGVLTHSYVNGSASFSFSVTNEPQILSSTNPATLLNTNVSLPVVVTDAGQSVTYSNGVDYVAVALPNGTTQLQWVNTSAIADGATVLVSYSWTDVVRAGLTLTVSNDVTVAAGGRLDASGLGYAANSGPGRGAIAGGSFGDGAGAGYGGSGGMSASNAVGGVCYGSVAQPTDLGSCGGSSYAGFGGGGGGFVQIFAGGIIRVDGAILANGANATNSRAGGGSGGSIWLSATNLTGAGSIAANGGAGEPVRGGGGGGGRIALQCGTNNFSGSLTAYGGTGSKTGGAGTIFTTVAGQHNFLLVDNGGQAGTNSTITLPAQTDVLIRGHAGVIPSGAWSAGNVTIATNSALLEPVLNTLNLNVNGTLVVQAGGQIIGDALGSTPGGGAGAGRSYSDGANYPCSGGGYGGNGALGFPASVSGGVTYGSASSPTSFGSGGGNVSPSSIGGFGGGQIQIFVSGALQLDGRISASGGSGSGSGGGGGSGGGIYLTASSVTGAGTFAANGGSGASTVGGGGGGGRIAIFASTTGFNGTMTAAGGGGANYGGAGTIYLQQTGFPSYQLILDNAGHAGTNTPLLSQSAATLIVRNGAIGTSSSAMSFSGLTIMSNSWLAVAGPIYDNQMSVTILGNATIQAGGGITANASGGTSTGAGLGTAYNSPPYSCGGGGHGGVGGNAAGNFALGGSASDSSVTLPTSTGGAGGTYQPYSFGGPGGGVVMLTVNGALQLDGTISANGASGTGEGGGGGAGGSLNLNVGILTGAGSLMAGGGSGANAIGGGGGGGCIALTLTSNLFAGSITAYGGGGANYGGAGTIYIKTNSYNHGALIVDNAGHVGASSLAYSSSIADLTLRNGAVMYSPFNLTLGNLIISSNAWLVVSNFTSPASVNLTVSGNVIIQPGGGINADITGYRSALGSGAGGNFSSQPYYPGGGGGHGGYGGNGFTNSTLTGGVGGYDIFNAPASAGSGGGGYSPYSFGGNGGGIIQMNVTGTLQVDGSLTANGGNGSGTGGGGGAGGSLYLTVGSLAGGGVIAANGGNGVDAIGGGGGGGNIAITFTSNLFAGTLSAYGGAGATYGGAGIIYFQTNGVGGSAQAVIVDNGGHRGTNTPLPNAISGASVTLRNGALVIPATPSQTIVSLLVASNATLFGYNGALNLNVSGNATVQSGGTLTTDSAGSVQNTGNGHGLAFSLSPYYPCSGGGHGGYGAFSVSNLVGGGFTYDSSLQPTTPGSGGGGASPNSIGGAGGGYVTLHVTGALRVDGLLSANGGNGSGSGGGGGAGGSINLNLGSLAGAGAITANGGNGAQTYGGGGGGGRIALYYTSNLFTGTVSAYGGGGANYGGAGTVYYKTNSQLYGLLVLDNANNAGTNTTFDALNSITDMTIQKKAIGVVTGTGGGFMHNLLIRTNGLLTFGGSSSHSILANFITIDPGGGMAMDGAGYGPQNGAGAGNYSSTMRGGGSHGGYGGGNVLGGAAYDGVQTPLSFGSGGASYASGPPYSYGGTGGGSLQFVASVLTVNGTLSVNGSNGGPNSGGGAGGSLYLQNIAILAGSGIISAHGGAAGSGSAGGGGGGRISAICTSNNFTGQFSATGGGGLYPGGAGTIYTRVANASTLTVDNGGLSGTNTPLSSAYFPPTAPYNLNISGGATVVPLTPLTLLSNLTISAGSTLTMPVTQSNLTFAVLKNFNLAGSLNLDNKGYPQANGPGAGTTSTNQGSGGGYGGLGGNSANGTPGGTNYGSAPQPVDFGSGGGTGLNTVTGGSEGGGAVRVSVGGTFTVNGSLSANGDYGWQDNSGGGAGGSIWITAGTLAGAGNISVAGGSGDLYSGGGGGGGRIALYALTNHFTGTTNLSGGNGASPGQSGTLFLSSVLPPLLVTAQTPVGTVSNTVSTVSLTFGDALLPASLSAGAFTLNTPIGPLPPGVLSVTVVSPNTVQVNFPAQDQVGDYSLQVATTVSGIFGQPLASVYTGGFTIVLPTLSGTVTDTNGAPVVGVLLQPDGGLSGVTTDTNGNYSFGVPVGWNGTVTPSLGTLAFVPGSLSYTNVTDSLVGQNYLMVPTVAPSLTTSAGGGSLFLNWPGLAGVTYQVMLSTNLSDWQPLGDPLSGYNGPMQISLPIGTDPADYFRLSVTH